MSVFLRLTDAVAAVCPIAGLRVGTGREVAIDYLTRATAGQRAAAAAVVAGFDWSDAAEAAWEEDRVPERKALRVAAAAAVADIDTYLGIGSPTPAQVAAQVRRLSQMTRAVILRLAQVE